MERRVPASRRRTPGELLRVRRRSTRRNGVQARPMRRRARIASDAGELAGYRGTTGERKLRTGLGGRSAGGEAAQMTGCNPTAGDDRFERLRDVRESNLQGSGRFGSGLVAELADCTVLVRCVVFVADGLCGRGAGQHQRQEDNPGAPTGTTCSEPRVHGVSLGHKLSTLAEIGPRWQGARPDGRALTPARFASSIGEWRHRSA